ncbi:ADP-ribosylglycohydrolase family protein [Bacillus sp. NP157]|nr:ADP-ribosylglycohydrolase family protein [Bacillus sp. NP157]
MRLESISLLDRYQGCLVGLACGDAVGTTVEFSPRGSFTPVTDMVGGGVFDLRAGEWTDDTSMALCLAQSFLSQRAHDPADQLRRYLNWWHHGYMSSNGVCFDIGSTVATALHFHEQHGNLVAVTSDPKMAGNGSIMRLAPAVLWAFPGLQEVLRIAVGTSLTTHAAAEAVDACRVLAVVLVNALQGAAPADLLEGAAGVAEEPKLKALANRDIAALDVASIRGSGYAVDSLEAALWCVMTTGSYRDAALAAANLGDDADTTAAIAGQIAGAVHGINAIPPSWRETLAEGGMITTLATRLHDERVVQQG